MIHNITLRQLRYLVAVAETKHFGKAAEHCFVSQPALSTQIQALETALGIPLLERNKSRVLLTTLGEEVVLRAKQILCEVEDLGDLVRSAAQPLTRPIRMGVIPTISPYVLPPILPQLRLQYPQLKLILQEEKTELLLQRLREGKLDLALLALPVEGEGTDFKAYLIVDEPFVLATPTQHHLAHLTQITTDTLTGQEVLLLEDGHCLRDQALEICRLRGANENSVIQAGSLGTLTQMVANGLGITLLPMMALSVETRLGLDIHICPFTHPEPSRTLGLLWRSTASREREFMMLLEFFRPLVKKLLKASQIHCYKKIE